MKAKSVFAAFAVASFGGLTVATAEPAAGATTEKSAATAAEGETVKAFIVTVTGGGWGAGRTVRAAMGTQEGIESYKMSGLRTTVFMEEGKSPDQAKLTEVLEEAGMSLISVEEKQLPVPDSAYMLMVKGAGWAETNDKARVALEALPGIAAAYVNKELEIQLTEDAELDEAKVKEVLSKYKITVESVKEMML